MNGRTLATSAARLIGDLRSSRLRRNAVAGSGEVLATALIAAASYPVYLAFLGYELYGLWLTLGIVMTFAGAGKVGLNSALTKYVAEESSRENIMAVRSYITTTLAVLTGTGLIMLAFVLALRGHFAALMHLSPSNSATVLRLAPWIAVSTICVTQIEALNGVLIGMGRMDIAAALNVASRLISLLVAIPLLIERNGLVSLLLSNAVAYVVVYIAHLMAVQRIIGCECFVLSAFSLRRLRTLLGYGSSVFGSYLVNMLIMPFNKMIIARYAGISLVPVFEISYSFSIRLRSVVDSGFRAILPEISALQAQDDPRARRRILRLRQSAILWAFLMGLIVCGLAAVTATPAFKFYLGPRFHVLLPSTFRILLGGMVISVGSIPAYYTLLALAQVREVLVSHFVGAFANAASVLLGVCLVPHVTVTFVATCATVSFAASALYLLRIARPSISEPDHQEEALSGSARHA